MNIINNLSSKYKLKLTNTKQKPWGYTIGIEPQSIDKFICLFFPNLKLKTEQISPRFLIINPNSRLSWQWHHKRSEIWKVLKGPAGISLSKDDLQPTKYTVINVNSTIKVGPNIRHRITGLKSLAIVAEIWIHTNTNNPSDASDIVRLEDDYKFQRTLSPLGVNVVD